jgi:hypothetical protein
MFSIYGHNAAKRGFGDMRSLLLLSGLAAITAQAAIVCPPGHNLEDRDGNGLYDYACVADWNGDGTLEIVEDIQAAVAALNDPGPKLVELSAGSYLPPVVSPHQFGILELPSHTTLQGACDGHAILFGFPGTDVTSTQPVVTNVDYEGVGATDVHVRCLEVDGGWRGGDATGLGHRRMDLRSGTGCVPRLVPRRRRRQEGCECGGRRSSPAACGFRMIPRIHQSAGC